MSGHARLSPSNHRWAHCPGSVREEAAYPDISGEAAIDGTGSHLLLETCLKSGVRAEVYEGQILGTNHPDKPGGWTIRDDRVERVQMCLDYLSRRVSELGQVTVTSESRSNPGERVGREDWYGTCDVTIQSDEYVEVVDYKDGRGHVDVKNNSQLISYLFGKITLDTKKCRITIVQPKTNPVVRYQDLSVEEVVELAGRLAEAAEKTDAPDAPLIAGKWCQWCKHKKNCTAQTKQSLEIIPMIDLKFISDFVEKIESTTDEQLAQLADAKKGIFSFFEKVDAELENRLHAGKSVPGYALLAGNGSNNWNITEEELVKILKNRHLKNEEIYVSKVVSPAQFMKCSLSDVQKNKIKEQYVTYTPGKLRVSKVENKAVELFKEVSFI